jgi:hypothetical protein
MVVLFPLVCVAGENNCATCNDENTMCTSCNTGYSADDAGVCQGNLFVYTVLLPNPTITYLTVLVNFPITRFGSFREFDVQD